MCPPSLCASNSLGVARSAPSTTSTALLGFSGRWRGWGSCREGLGQRWSECVASVDVPLQGERVRGGGVGSLPMLVGPDAWVSCALTQRGWVGGWVTMQGRFSCTNSIFLLVAVQRTNRQGVSLMGQ